MPIENWKRNKEIILPYTPLMFNRVKQILSNSTKKKPCYLMVTIELPMILTQIYLQGQKLNKDKCQGMDLFFQFNNGRYRAFLGLRFPGIYCRNGWLCWTFPRKFCSAAKRVFTLHIVQDL